MTQLLVSVRDLSEAILACRANIGILDVKEPDHGALGAANAQTLDAIANVACKNIPKSFSAGELFDRKSNLANLPLDLLYQRSTLEKYQHIKVGLAGARTRNDWRSVWINFFKALPENCSPVAVAYLDSDACEAPSPESMVEFATQTPACQTILFDTFEKDDHLFEKLSFDRICNLVTRAKTAGLTTVLAGSINKKVLGQALSTGPHFIGVRGAICTKDEKGLVNRKSKIDLNAIEDFTTQLVESDSKYQSGSTSIHSTSL